MPGRVSQDTHVDEGRTHHKSSRRHRHHPSERTPSGSTLFSGNSAGPAVSSPQMTAMYRTSGGDSYRVPYPFKTTTTAYGLNEPQWSFGPPPLIHDLSPYSRVPLPPLFKIHPLLAFDGNPAITWLIDKHPQQAMPTPGNVAHGNAMADDWRAAVDMYHWKSLPATDPVMNTPLKIRVHPFTSLITVNPSQGGIITVGDVLYAVYHGIRQTATEAFCTGVGLDPSFISGREMMSYGRLVSQEANVGPPAGDDGVSSHVRHLLEFRTRWVGLTPSRKEAGVWVLHTRPIGD